jgi:hypothetical protein
VVLQHTRQLGLVVDLADPAGQLAVPAQSVTADRLVVCGGPVDQVIAAGKVEIALGGLGGIPLHAVLGRHLAKVGLDHGGRLAGAQAVLVGAGAVVELALGLDELVDRGRGLTLRQLGSRSCKSYQGAQEKECSCPHDERVYRILTDAVRDDLLDGAILRSVYFSYI